MHVFITCYLQELKGLGPTGVNILGFRSKVAHPPQCNVHTHPMCVIIQQEFLEPHYQVKPSMFARPTDKMTKGSVQVMYDKILRRPTATFVHVVQAFSSLYTRLLHRGKIAIAAVRATDASQPRLAALVPQAPASGFELGL